MATPFVIQFIPNPNFCLGATSASPNAPVVLSLLQGVGSSLTQWDMDPTTGLITLLASVDASSPLCLDFQGTAPVNGLPLIIATPTIGRFFQNWNWLGNPPFIQNVGAPTFCVDNQNGLPTAGNPIQLWTQISGDGNQQWRLLPVPSFQSLSSAPVLKANAAPAQETA